MNAELVLVLGGTRSGKSEFAEKYVLHQGALGAYIATAEILDDEMAVRVKLHKERRKQRWVNYEAPYAAEEVLPEAGQAADDLHPRDHRGRGPDDEPGETSDRDERQQSQEGAGTEGGKQAARQKELREASQDVDEKVHPGKELGPRSG